MITVIFGVIVIQDGRNHQLTLENKEMTKTQSVLQTLKLKGVLVEAERYS